MDAAVTIVAGASGGVFGASLGSVGGPIGMIAAGIAGGIISSNAARLLSDRLTQKLFGVPKDEALENAHRFLGVSTTCSNEDINKAYRALCLKHHPDKGGKAADFHLVQVNMAIVKVARGEVF